MGWGEDVSVGPFTPPLSAPLCPGALEGRDWTLARQGYVLCQHAQLHAREFTAQALGSQLAWIWLRVAWVPGGQHLGDQSTHEDSPAWPSHPGRIDCGGDWAGSYLGAPWSL